jgi:hypothetical protein
MTTNPLARLSIVVYQPKPGKEADLMALALEHVPLLRKLGMVTERAHVVATAGNGAIVEVFEWEEGGLQLAHEHPAVQDLWRRYAEACDYVPLNTLAEAGMMFANFVPVN